MTLYNEIDPYPAQWLRNLIAAGHLPWGRVDERSIADLRPEDCPDTAHFFAGIGGWPLALELAGWTGPVWTGSCPCQPFSSAGAKKGTDDARHIWPTWCTLIGERLPSVIFGEQVASPLGRDWLDAVSVDLEALGYAVATADLCAAGIGAPHIRQRLYWVAHRASPGRDRLGSVGLHDQGPPGAYTDGRGPAHGVVDAHSEGPQGRPADAAREGAPTAVPGGARGVEYADDDGAGRDGGTISRTQTASGLTRIEVGGVLDCAELASATRGFWGDAEWLACRDERVRPVEPGAFPLADGVPGRVGQARAYGNAIVPQVAAAFIGSVMECIDL